MAKTKYSTSQVEPSQPTTDAAITIEINDTRYGTRYMDPLLVLQHSGKVFAFMGGSLGSMSLSKGALELASNLGDLGIMKILTDCFELASADGRELGRNNHWRQHFRGKQRELVQVIAWMLEVHFADFFDETTSAAVALFSRIKGSQGSGEEQTEESTSPTT